ncbi:Protein CBG25166 [Caenorhabditis briggsae]|uniref:Protein CBG25166 n=1 Tax=Caenorhabditis briggsae TaxID=6238 RepID=B6IEL7_CAEBR|nr:Protein CBG25166 [Caenorhabditis briggsae]CAR98347.1 Protein CBG25166 [Caenorhabditis briggsae]
MHHHVEITSSMASSDSPRVPLIDLPQPFDTKISRDRFKLVYNGNRELLSILKPCEITEKHVDVTCHHCPGSPKFATVWETMQHVFNEIHAQNINYIGTSKDFFHYKLLLKRVLVKQPLPGKTTVLENGETGKYCRGPTNRQILFIQSLRVREDVKFFEKPMKCLLCQLDMSNFSILDVARHAFSIKHLEKALSRCNMFFVEEFEWWMEKLKTSSNLIPSEPSESAEYYVGGLKTIIGNRYIPVFEKLTEKELNLISNVDEQKVRENEEVLLRRFGGCIYCDLWIPTPTDIFPHFFSEQHFEKVREHHPVKQFDVDDVMSLVKLCQKSDC